MTLRCVACLRYSVCLVSLREGGPGGYGPATCSDRACALLARACVGTIKLRGVRETRNTTSLGPVVDVYTNRAHARAVRGSRARAHFVAVVTVRSML